MKLLLDQNLSFKLVKMLDEYFPGSAHISKFELEKSDDFSIWLFAKRNDFALVTRDVDFAELSVLRGFPPKIIWLRMGNTSTVSVFETIKSNFDEICSFLLDKESSCLQLF